MSFGERYDSTTKDFMSDFVGSNDVISLDKTASGNAVSFHKTETAISDNLIKESRSTVKHVMDIFDMANEAHGPTWWQWEPETLVATFSDKYLDVLQALQLLVTTNQAHEHWHVFEKVGHAFNNNVVDFSIVQPLRTDECALTLKVLRNIRPKEFFDAEVIGYVACCAKHDGLVFLPSDIFGKEFQSALDALENDFILKAKVIAGKPVDQDTEIQLKSIAEIRDYVGGKI